MKFEIKNRYTGNVQFTCDLDCAEDATYSFKLGLAIKIAIKENADLSYADLRYTDLRYADLSYADLSYVNLSYADLRYADLSYADLSYADLSYVNLSYADLRYADLRSADLSYADLSYADLSSADLSYADLSYVNLSYADLNSAKGEMKYIKSLQLDKYMIAYTHDVLQIGCKKHLISEWWEFTDKEIIAMDGKEALEWWRAWKPILQNIIEVSPAMKPEIEEKQND